MKRVNNISVASSAAFLVLLSVFFFLPVRAAGPDTAGQAGRDVAAAVGTLKTAAARKDQWEADKAELVAAYIHLARQKQDLLQEQKRLVQQRDAQRQANQVLAQEKIENLKILKELPLFLETLVRRLVALVDSDAPFLASERRERLERLSRMMADPEVTLAEKYRKVMEALFIEAEYGATIEVCQEKIVLAEGQSPLVNTFRLGRVSFFFLSLDRERCGIFNPANGRWQPLDSQYLPAIRSAVDMGNKQRPAELLDLPIGQLGPVSQSQNGGAS